MTKDEILAALPKLKRADLEAVAAMAGALLGGRISNVDAPATTLTATCWQALSDALNLTAGYANVPPAVRASFDKQLPNTIEFFNTNFKGWDDNQLGQLAFLRMMFEALRDYLKAGEIKPTYKSMINSMPHMGRAFDNLFPGYLEAGATSIIMARFK